MRLSDCQSDAMTIYINQFNVIQMIHIKWYKKVWNFENLDLKKKIWK